MLYYTVNQWQVFLLLTAAGALCGCWYGFMAHTGALLEAGPWLRAFLDGLTALGIWLILTLALVRACWGEVRLYALAGAWAGFLLQRCTLGRLAPGLIRGMGKGLIRGMEKISRVKWIKKFFR